MNYTIKELNELLKPKVVVIARKNGQDHKVLEDVLELIERATPKKVITEGHSEELGKCPTCRMLMDQLDYPHFCPRKGCGQAVYWSEDEPDSTD